MLGAKHWSWPALFPLLVALLVAATPCLSLSQTAHAATSSGEHVHDGVASCSGSTCHGRSVASGLVVRQNELMTWQDPAGPAGAHSRAWRVLAEPRAQAMAARLGLDSAQSAPECTGCHADPAPPRLRGATFQVSDGVGCEACHGGSGDWLASHTGVAATHAGNAARGMVRLDDPKVRAGVCLNCHLGGDERQFATHRLMAAGHPRLSFELDLFSALQRHYDIDADYSRRKQAADGVKAWAVGEAMALDRVLTLYGARGQNGVFPEFSFFDCHSCHRAISDDPKTRLTVLANPGRPVPIGTPPFNDENMIMLSAAVQTAAPALAGRFAADSRAFHAALPQGRSQAAKAAQQLAATARALSSTFAARSFRREETFAILQSVLSDATAARYTDYAGGAQAVMAVDTLLNALASAGEVSPAAVARMRPDIDLAYQAVRDPNTFRPEDFHRSLQHLAADVRGLR